MTEQPDLPKEIRPYLQPYSSAEESEAAYAQHVAKSHTDFLQRSKLAPHKVHYGERLNGRVQDMYTGRWYFDCHRNGSLFNLGHRHPELIKLAHEALDYLDAGSFSQIPGYRAALAQKLSASTGGALTGAIFGCNGGEAIEIAAHAARNYTGRKKFIAIADSSFHGNGEFGLSISGIHTQLCERYCLDTPNTIFVPFNDLAAMKAALADADVAAVIMEPTPAQGAFPDADPGYLKQVKAECEAQASLFILDDVQTGLGGTGAVWSYEHDGYVPDILVAGKGLGGGLFPVSAAIMSEPVWRTYTDGQFAPHGSTYGGAELSCVVAAKVMDLTTDPAFIARVRDLAERFTRGFANAPFKVTQTGLCIGLWTGDSLAASAALANNGVLTIPTGEAPALPFRPILTISDDEADEIIAIVRETFG